MRFRLLRREKGAPRRPAPAPEPTAPKDNIFRPETVTLTACRGCSAPCR